MAEQATHPFHPLEPEFVPRLLGMPDLLRWKDSTGAVVAEHQFEDGELNSLLHLFLRDDVLERFCDELWSSGVISKLANKLVEYYADEEG